MSTRLVLDFLVLRWKSAEDDHPWFFTQRIRNGSAKAEAGPFARIFFNSKQRFLRKDRKYRWFLVVTSLLAID